MIDKKLMNRGLIIQIEGKEARILTDQGEFVAVKSRTDMFPGQVIEYRERDLIKNGDSIRRYWGIAASVAAVVAMVFLYFNFLRVPSEYAYLNVDINPSLEMVIDRDYIVLEASPINNDAKGFLKGLNLESKPVDAALKEVMYKAKQDGFINSSKDNIILVSASLNENNAADDKINNLLNLCEVSVKGVDNDRIIPKTMEITPKERKKAKQEGMSMGRYFMYEKAKNQGINVTLDEVKEEKVSEIIKKVELGEEKTAQVNQYTVTPVPTSGQRPKNTQTPVIHSTPEIQQVPRGQHTLIPIETKVQPGTGTGLLGSYFNSLDFRNLCLTRIDTNINFDWGENSIVDHLITDRFSIRWTGMIEPKYSQVYTFYTETDDGVRLWVDDKLIIDKWIDQERKEWSGTIPLTAGKKYSIQMEYYDIEEHSVAKLYWSSTSQLKEIVPASQLYPDENYQKAVSIVAFEDATVQDGQYAEKNYGQDPYLYVKGNTKTGSDYNRRIFLKFDTGNIKSDEIKSISLKLTLATTTGRVNYLYGISDDSWSQNTITWNSKPSETGISLGEMKVIDDTEGEVYSMDVTDFVKKHPNQIVSFYLDGDNSQHPGRFYSLENEKTYPKPYLTVVYK